MTRINTDADTPAKEVEIKTEPVRLSVAAAPRPRPDLAGLRVKLPDDPRVFLIDPKGFRRHIPDEETYNNLFRSWDGIIAHPNVNTIAEDCALTGGAILIRANSLDPVYIVSNRLKRWITSAGAMDKYNFSWNRIYMVPHVLPDFIPSGPPWS